MQLKSVVAVYHFDARETGDTASVEVELTDDFVTAVRIGGNVTALTVAQVLKYVEACET